MPDEVGRIGKIVNELRHSPGAALTVLALPTIIFIFQDVTRIGDNRLNANFFLASLCVLSVVGVVLNQMARGLSADFLGHWGERKDLPAGGLGPLIAERAVSAVVMVGMAIAPLVIVALLISPASLSLGVWIALALSLAAGGIPIALFALVLALWWPLAARTIAGVSYFVLALGAGLILPPQSMPFFIWRAAVVLPSRHYGDVAWAPVLGWDFAVGNWLWLIGFTALFGIAALVGLRRETPAAV